MEVAYIVGGLLLPLFYLPQVTSCWRDRTGLASYSVSKCVTQVACRVVMMPFIVAYGPALMVFIVSIDLLGRLVELWAAIRALRLVGWSWQAIVVRAVTWDLGVKAEPQRMAEDVAPAPVEG